MAGVVAVTATDVLAAVPVTGAAPAGLTRTGGAARAWSGVSVSSFQNTVSVQSASAAGIRAIGPDAVTMARAEGLDAHANAVALRIAKAAA